MTVIRPNSISGVSSITGSGGDINLFRADGTKADVPTVNNITAGVITATKFVGPIEGSGANLTSIPAAQLTGTVADARISTLTSSKLSGALPALDGSALTGVGVGTADSINTSGIITATAFIPSQGQLSHRNLVINGDFRISQRATSSASNGYTSVDRWKIETSNITHNSTKSQQSLSSSDTPYTLGFRKFARIALAQAGVVAANSAAEIQQRIEAQNIATSGWNYTSASSNITLQFWFRCSTNQTFYGYLYSFDGTAQLYTFSFTASANNTWTKITKTIPGNSNLTFNNDNGAGLQLKLIAFYGTDYTNNLTLNQWGAIDGANQMPDMASTWLTAGASTFDITGVQLEVGTVATPFEHRSIGEEFRRCQRYYQQYVNISAVGYVPNNGSRTYSHGFFFPVEMRAAPTMSITNTGSSNGQYITDGSTNRYVSSVLSQGSKTTHMSVSFNLTGDLTDYRGAYLFATGNTTYQTTYKIAAEL